MGIEGVRCNWWSSVVGASKITLRARLHGATTMHCLAFQSSSRRRLGVKTN